MKNNLNHIAFIMDGNGRWAKQINKPRTYGHKQGVKVIPEIIEACVIKKIAHVSFFAFSTENWNRPKAEVDFLMKLISINCNKDLINKINELDYKINWIGFEDNLSPNLIKKLNNVVEKTKNNKKITVNIFFNYSGTKDIENAFKIKNDKNNIKENLLTKDLPPVDLLIRTGNEKRISNFCLYDLSYSEIIFESSYWPEYNKDLLEINLKEYNNRSRRFGKI